MEEVKKQTEEEIMRECLGEDFFEGDIEPEINNAIQESTEEIINVESTIINLDTPEEPKQIEVKEEKKSGIDFSKRLNSSKKLEAEKVETPVEEVQIEEAEVKEIDAPVEKTKEVPEQVQGETVYQSDIKMTTTVVDTKAGTEDEVEEVLATVKFKDIPSKVFFKKGLTRNLGNFESYRVDVGIEMPCATSDLTKYVLEGGKVVEHRLALEISKAQRLYGNNGNSVFDRVNVNL